MGRQSTIRKLPPPILEALEGWLRDPAVTQQEAARRTNELLEQSEPGRDPVSQSAVQRYHAEFRKTAVRMRETREIARLMIADMGSIPGGQVGHVLTELIRTASFSLARQIEKEQFDIETMPARIKQLKDLALISQRVEKASRESERRERQIRERTKEEAAETAAAAASEGGMSAGTVEEIKRRILGVDA